MKALKSILTLTTLCLTALAVQTSSAQIVGPLSFPINDPTNRLWDFSLLTNQLQNLRLHIQQAKHGGTDEVEIVYSDPFTQNGHGKLAGAGTNVEVAVIDQKDNGMETNTFTGKYSTSGSVTSSKGVAHLTFNSRASGKLTFSGDTRPTAVSASANYVVKFDAIAGQLSGRSVEHAAAAGKGSLSETKAIGPNLLADLAPEMGDGSWMLVLTFTAPRVNNKYVGTATVNLSSGQVYSFNFTGTYNPKTDQSKLNLKAADDASKGSILQVTLQGDTLFRAVGQVSGQLVNIK